MAKDLIESYTVSYGEANRLGVRNPEWHTNLDLTPGVVNFIKANVCEDMDLSFETYGF